MIGLMIIAPLLPLYAKHLGAQVSTIGYLVSMFAIAQLLASPIWGRVSDRHGRRPVLLIALVSSGVAYVVFGFANALWLLFLCRFVQGFGGGTTGVAQAYVADTMAPHERAKALGWLSAATSLGVSIGGAISAFAHNLWGDKGPGLTAAALVLVNLVFAWKWLPESRTGLRESGTFAPKAPSLSDAVLQVLRPTWNVLRHPGRPVSQVIWVYAVGMLALNSLITVMTLYLGEHFGATLNNVGYIFAVFSVVGVAMRVYPVGWINAKLGEVRTMRLGTAFLIVGFALMPIPASLTLFICALVLVPVGNALLFPATSALVSHRSDKSEYGAQMGAQQTVRGFMAILGPVGAGYAYQYLGSKVPFVICAGIVTAAAVLALRVQPAPEPASVPAPAH
jgi:MFS family permease